MATAQLKTLTSGPTYVNPSGATNIAATWSLATVTNGLSDGYLCYLQVVAALFDSTGGSGSGATGSANYSTLITATACLKYTAAGPVYTLGAVSTNIVNAGSDGTMFDSHTLDVNSGNLRLVINATGHNEPFICYALLNTLNSK